MQRKTQIELLKAAKAELEVNVPTSSLIAEIAFILKEPELPFDDGYVVHSMIRDRVPPPPPPATLPRDKQFDGTAYDPDLDKERLSKQIERVFAFMKSGDWHTLREITAATKAPEASASACLRDFRKARNGSHTVHKRRKGEPKHGRFEYRLELNTPQSS